MTDAAKLAAVLVRLLACAVVASTLLGTLARLLFLMTASADMRRDAFYGPTWTAWLVWLAAGVLLFRQSRAVGRWLARGLD